jgi:hypothetical protein
VLALAGTAAPSEPTDSGSMVWPCMRKRLRRRFPATTCSGRRGGEGGAEAEGEMEGEGVGGDGGRRTCEYQSTFHVARRTLVARCNRLHAPKSTLYVACCMACAYLEPPVGADAFDEERTRRKAEHVQLMDRSRQLLLLRSWAARGLQAPDNTVAMQMRPGAVSVCAAPVCCGMTESGNVIRVDTACWSAARARCAPEPGARARGGVRLVAGGDPLQKRARSALSPRGRRCRCPQAEAEATPGCRSIESPPIRRHRHRPVRPRSPSHRDIRPMTGRPNCFLLSCHPAVRTPDAVSSPASCASAPAQSHMTCPSSTKAPATLLDIARGLRSTPLQALSLQMPPHREQAVSRAVSWVT